MTFDGTEGTKAPGSCEPGAFVSSLGICLPTADRYPQVLASAASRQSSSLQPRSPAAPRKRGLMASTSTGSVRDMFTGQDQSVLHCAVYTRQSVANAQQDLTSCDVQRERRESYIRAMQYEGWQLLDEHFDDIGVSGAELGCPGLDKLESWCVHGRVDVLVVARLDRLTHNMSHRVESAAVSGDADTHRIRFLAEPSLLDTAE